MGMPGRGGLIKTATVAGIGALGVYLGFVTPNSQLWKARFYSDAKGGTRGIIKAAVGLAPLLALPFLPANARRIAAIPALGFATGAIASVALDMKIIKDAGGTLWGMGDQLLLQGYTQPRQLETARMDGYNVNTRAVFQAA